MDFNIRDNKEQLYIDSPVITDSLDLLLQEIDILLNTPRNTVLGNLDMGLDFESMLWKTNVNSRYLSSIVYRSIIENCYSSVDFDIDVNVEMYKGSNKDIGVMTIHIKDQDGLVVGVKEFIYR